MNQKNEKSIPLLYGQYRISSISGTCRKYLSLFNSRQYCLNTRLCDFLARSFFLKHQGFFFFIAETISLKSYQEKVPRSFLIPGSSNRIHVTASGFYSIYGSMCFSGRGFREDSISLAVRLEQVRGGSKRTVIRRSATLHRHPSSFVDVHFMESVWLNKATDLFLFISHPNALYSFPECNILMLFKTK